MPVIPGETQRCRLCVAIIRLLLTLNAQNVGVPAWPRLKTFTVLCIGIILVADRRIRLTNESRVRTSRQSEHRSFLFGYRAKCLRGDGGGGSATVRRENPFESRSAKSYPTSGTVVVISFVSTDHYFRLYRAILNAIARIAGVDFREHRTRRTFWRIHIAVWIDRGFSLSMFLLGNVQTSFYSRDGLKGTAIDLL